MDYETVLRAAATMAGHLFEFGIAEAEAIEAANNAAAAITLGGFDPLEVCREVLQHREDSFGLVVPYGVEMTACHMRDAWELVAGGGWSSSALPFLDTERDRRESVRLAVRVAREAA